MRHGDCHDHVLLPCQAVLVLREGAFSVTLPAPQMNHLIESLPLKERQRILRLCKTVDLAYGTILCEVDAPFQHAYFPLTGLILTGSDYQ